MQRPLVDHAATVRAGQALAPMLAAGDVIALVGDLGAGKTTFTAAVVAALGVPAAAHSPTFALVNRYDGGRLTVWHIDLYRIEHARELPELGLDDVLGVRTGPTAGVAFVEWADSFPQVLPADHLRLLIEYRDAGRTLSATSHGPRSAALLAAWDGAHA